MLGRVTVLGERADLAEVEAWAATFGPLVEDQRRGHVELALRRWRATDHSEVALMQDHVADVAYVTMVGPSAEPWEQELRHHFPWDRADELLADLTPDCSARVWIRTLSKLAVLRPNQPSVVWRAAWQRALAHPHRAVRRAGIRTLYGCGWPELPELIAARLRDDVELGGLLRQLLEHLRRTNPDLGTSISRLAVG